MLIYYLGNRNEDDFVTTAVKLDYPMLTNEMDNITAATPGRKVKWGLRLMIVVLVVVGVGKQMDDKAVYQTGTEVVFKQMTDLCGK